MFGLLIVAVISAQAGAPMPLFDGKSLQGWTVEGAAAGTFTVREGVLRVEGTSGWLKSERPYGDLRLTVEVRFLTDDADSGVFVRAVGETVFMRGWPGNSYQVQARDVTANRTTRPILIGNLYRHGNPGGETTFDADAAFKAARKTGEWQTFDIEVTGDVLTVSLNGQHVTRATGLRNPSGHIGLQGEAGIVEYRSIVLR